MTLVRIYKRARMRTLAIHFRVALPTCLPNSKHKLDNRMSKSSLYSSYWRTKTSNRLSARNSWTMLSFRMSLMRRKINCTKSQLIRLSQLCKEHSNSSNRIDFEKKKQDQQQQPNMRINKNTHIHTELYFHPYYI